MNRQHTHLTRDIKPPGLCPACDEYYQAERVRRIQELRRSNAAQPIPARRPDDTPKHRKRDMEDRDDH